MLDVPFLRKILAHTIKTIDKCDGSAKRLMQEQASRLQSQIEEATKPKKKSRRKKK